MSALLLAPRLPTVGKEKKLKMVLVGFILFLSTVQVCYMIMKSVVLPEESGGFGEFNIRTVSG